MKRQYKQKHQGIKCKKRNSHKLHTIILQQPWNKHSHYIAVSDVSLLVNLTIATSSYFISKRRNSQLTEISCTALTNSILSHTHTPASIASAASFKGPGWGSLPYHNICLCICELVVCGYRRCLVLFRSVQLAVPSVQVMFSWPCNTTNCVVC